jgi:tight adherence protein C
MDRSRLFLFLAAVVIGAIAFGGTLTGLQPTRISPIAGTIGSIAGLAAFFMILFSLEKANDQYDMSQRFTKLRLDRDHRSRRKRKDLELMDSGGGLLAVLAGLSRRILFLSDGKLPGIRLRLQSAGFYGDGATTVYIILKSVSPLIGVILAATVARLHFEVGTNNLILSAALGAVLGWMATDYILDKRINSRQKKVAAEFPDVIDMFMIYTESGMSFDASLPRVAAAMAKQSPSSAAELKLLERELRLLPDRGKAYENIGKRCNVGIVKNFASVIRQSEVLGTPISKAMKTLGDEARRERALEAERKAAKLPVLIQIPVVLFILPAIILIVIGPTGIKLVEAFANR